MISGNKSTRQEYDKQVGMMEAEVVSFNPTREELEDLLGTEIKEDIEYLGESKDGNTTMQVSVWLKEKKTGRLFNERFFLEDRVATTKDGKKTWYVNASARAACVDDEDNLTEKFRAHEYHAARVGEVELLNFLDAWLDLEWESKSIVVDWKALMKGSVKEFRELQKTDLPRSVCVMGIVRVVEKDGEKKEYQGIYNRKTLPGFAMGKFRLTNFTEEKLTQLREKKGTTIDGKDGEKKKVFLKDWEDFAVQVSDPEHGCKDAYSLKEMHPYNPDDFVQAGDKVITTTGADY